MNPRTRRIDTCCAHPLPEPRLLILGAHQGGHATARFLEGFLEGSFKEVLLGRVLRRCLCVRVSIETQVLRRLLRRGGAIEGA